MSEGLVGTAATKQPTRGRPKSNYTKVKNLITAAQRIQQQLEKHKQLHMQAISNDATQPTDAEIEKHLSEHPLGPVYKVSTAH